MKKFKVKITKKGKYKAELFGDLKSLSIALAQLMQENEVVKELVIASVEVSEILEADKLEKQG